MNEVVHSADSQLRSPRRFASDLRADLRVAPEVAWRLFLHGLRAGYRRSRLGYLWLLLPPSATAAMWVYLNRARVLDVGPTEVPYPVYVLAGTLLWQVFVEALHSPLQQLSAARNILTKSRTPHEALMLAGVFEVAFNFCVRAAVIVPALVWFGTAWSFSALLLAPVGAASLLLLGYSLGLLLTPLGLLYQDVSRGLNLFAGFWFFLTPVIYQSPERGPAALLSTLNPVAPLLLTTRRWLTLGAVAPARGFLPVIVLSVLLLALALVCYRLAKPHLVARL